MPTGLHVQFTSFVHESLLDSHSFFLIIIDNADVYQNILLFIISQYIIC